MPRPTNYYGLILAGGRGTRFWPRSRRKHSKQVLKFLGDRTLIQQTVDRLSPVIPPQNQWILTNHHLHAGKVAPSRGGLLGGVDRRLERADRAHGRHRHQPWSHA